MAKQTEDYKQFKVLKGNRRVLSKHVDNLAQSIALNPDLLRIRPILVNKDFEVIDGQHRLAAAKKLKVPVWYEDGGNLTAEDAVIINNNQRNWSMLDYIRNYAAYGKQDYKALLSFHDEHSEIPIYTILRYIGGPAYDKARVVRNGEFKATNLELGQVLLEQLAELAEIYPRFLYTAPARAMYNIFQIPGFNFDRLLKKLSTIPSTHVKLLGTVEEILRNLEDIYNYRQQTDIARFY